VTNAEPSPFLTFCKNWWFILGPLSALFCSLLGYLILESVGSPYWQVSDGYQQGADSYKTLLIVNPGPWSKRKPSIEFPVSAHVRIVSTSGWVGTEGDGTTFTVSSKSDIPPGVAFFVTYACSSTNQVEAKVFCDAKPCRNTPSSIDLDLILKLLGLLLVGFLMALFIFTILFFTEKAEHKKTKEGIVHQALNELLSREQKRQSQADIAETEETVEGLSEKVGNIRSRAC
jgi:hypothetical protein